MKLKRSLFSYLAYLMFIFIFSNSLFIRETTSFGWVELINLSGLLLFIAVLVRILINPKYIEVTDDKIIIYRDFFYSDKLPLNEMERLNLSPYPFTRSYFLTKSGKKVAFVASELKTKDINLLTTYLSKQNIFIS